MNNLPDIQSSKTPQFTSGPLDWVGIKNVKLPIRTSLKEPTWVGSLSAGVNLTAHEARGIHMSRLYSILEQDLELCYLVDSPISLFDLHHKILDSQSGLATSAELKIKFDYIYHYQSLKSDRPTSKVVPIQFLVTGTKNEQKLSLSFEIIYSSTCPQSYALSAQAMSEAFDVQFKGESSPAAHQVKAWIEQGLVATPHAQRSLAHLEAGWENQKSFTKWMGTYQQGPSLPMNKWIESLDKALGTPSQSLVKREDEKAFALLNAQNTMFCEDAARRLQRELASWKFDFYQGEVTHFESLHPFDVRAQFSSTPSN